MKAGLTHELSIILKILLVTSSRYRGTKVKAKVGCWNCLCFTITVLSYLVVRIFYDIVQPSL